MKRNQTMIASSKTLGVTPLSQCLSSSLFTLCTRWKKRLLACTWRSWIIIKTEKSVGWFQMSPTYLKHNQKDWICQNERCHMLKDPLSDPWCTDCGITKAFEPAFQPIKKGGLKHVLKSPVQWRTKVLSRQLFQCLKLADAQQTLTGMLILGAL